MNDHSDQLRNLVLSMQDGLMRGFNELHRLLQTGVALVPEPEMDNVAQEVPPPSEHPLLQEALESTADIREKAGRHARECWAAAEDHARQAADLRRAAQQWSLLEDADGDDAAQAWPPPGGLPHPFARDQAWRRARTR